MNLSTAIMLAGEISAMLAVIVPMIVWVNRIGNAQKCMLRSDMLHIYYRCRESRTIRQFEYENFVMLYEGYKALKGNSFIDKIYKEIQEWEVIS